MIDWLTIKLNFRHLPINAGRIISLGDDDAVEWQSPKRKTIRGSYETAIKCRSSGGLDSDGFCEFLELDGNPAKYIQGHNVFGTDDICLLTARFFKLVCAELKLPYSIFDIYRIIKGDFFVNRIDINYMFSLNSNADPDRFLIALGETSGTKYRKAYSNKGSIYFNQGSRRWSSVWYNKSSEIKVRRKDQKQQLDKKHMSEISSLINKCVRAEVKLLSLELKDLGIVHGYDIVNYGIKNLFENYINRIQISGNIKMSDKKLHDMPKRLRGTYELWRSGCDLRSVLSDRTFYRHKSELRAYGVNIDDSCREIGSNVVSINSVIEATPMEIPSYFYEHDLIVCGRAV